MAFFHTGDISEMESIRLQRLAAMAGSAFYKASGAGKFSTEIFILGQRFQQQGGLLLKNRISSEPLSGDVRQIKAGNPGEVLNTEISVLPQTATLNQSCGLTFYAIK